MDVDLSILLERAQIDAQRRQNARVEPEHLLFVILEEPVVASALLKRGIDLPELREALDLRFGELGATGLTQRSAYRDASITSSIECSPALDQVIDRLDERTMNVLDSLFIDRGIAKLTLSLRRGEGRLILERATALAVVKGHRKIDVEHIAKVLLDVPVFVAAIKRTFLLATTLEKAVDDVLNSTSSPSTPREPTWARPIAELLQRASDHLHLVTAANLCVALLYHEDTRRQLVKLGFTDVFALVYSLVHNEPVPIVDVVLKGGPWLLHIHHDNVTPRDFVRLVLRQFFDIPEYNMASLIYTLDQTGSIVVGTYDRPRARVLWKQVLSLAETSLAPLRITATRAQR